MANLMHLPVVAAVAVLAPFLAAGCGEGPGRKELQLHCGAGIRPAAEALIRAFEARRPVKVSATYAGSGRQLGQISASAVGDLFMPGAEFYVDRAVEKGLAFAETRRVVAYFVPVIFVRKGNPLGIHSLGDLAREGLRLGFGDERACAVGEATRAILEKSSLPRSDIERNVVFRSGTVNELGVAIQLGSVDAVVLWDANARQFAEHGDAIEIPPQQNVLVTIPIVVLSSSRHPDEARAFVEFVTSPEGRGILSDLGYTVAVEQGR